MKRRRVQKDKKTKIPKKYLTGLSGRRRSKRAKLIKKVSAIYKKGGYIPVELLRRRTRA